MASPPKPTFKNEQRRELEHCGLLPEQIEELELRLPYTEAFMRAPPAKGAIRSHLRKVSKPLAEAIAAIDALERAAFANDTPDGPSIDRIVLPHFRRATVRLLPGVEALAAWDSLNLESARVQPLRDLLQQFSQAESKVMAAGQSRRRVSWQPIYWILRALESGWNRYRDEAGEGTPYFSPPEVQSYKREAPSTFDRIAKTCFEAAGIFSSPDKAIRAWLEREDARRQKAVEKRKAENESLPEGEKHRPIDLEFTPRQRFGKHSTTAARKK